MNDHKLSFIHRPAQTPSVSIPFGIRSCGHYQVLGDFADYVMEKEFIEIFWGIQGSGALIIDGKECQLGPQQLAIYFNNAKHQVYATESAWEYRWITFDGGLAASTIRAFGLNKSGIYNSGPAPIPLFEQLNQDMKDISPNGERKACATAFRILSHSAQYIEQQQTSTSKNSEQKQLIAKAMQHIHKHWNDPMLGVAQIAQHIGQHRSNFTKMFQAELSIAPKDYLTRLRVQYALNQLRLNDKPIKDVAAESGWVDPNYFSRCIKAATGLSPKQYRIHR